jgi:thioredoxin reductase
VSSFRWTSAAGTQDVPLREGQSIAAALTEAGIRRFRETRRAGPGRGVFCGMGVCQDCLVVVEGEPNQRACMTKAKPGLEVAQQAFPGAPALPRKPALPPGDAPAMPRVEMVDLLILGGGAAGLTAAITARRAGLDVLLVDERSAAGGQYYKQAAPGLAATPLDAQQQEGASLVAAAEASGARLLRGAELWAAFAPDSLAIFDGSTTRLVSPRALIVATGAQERGLPLPGWTLPGVMTVGAAQTLWRSYRTTPGKRVLVAGNGPLNLQVAVELAEAGCKVVAVAEAAPMRDLGASIGMAATDPALALRGLGYLAALRRHSIALRRGAQLVRVEQEGEALRATLRDAQGEHSDSVDAVLMGYGFLPANEVLRALGAAADHDTQRGHLVMRRDADAMTSLEGVYAIGDCAGLGGAPAAREEGVIAALAAARRLGRTIASDLAQEDVAARKRLARHRRFQAALWRVFAAPRPGVSLADDATLICRCEEVTKGEIIAVMADGDPAIGEVKRRTRCGMGRCQGRYCAPVLAEWLAETQGRPLDDRALFAPRAPVKPIAIADIVALGER